MAAKKKSKRGKVPGLLRHSSGQARVTLSGKTYYCGRYGSVASQKRYAELLERWHSNGRRPLERDPDVEQAQSMRTVFAAWEQYLDDAGRYRKNGKPTSQRNIVRVAVREFVGEFGDISASDFHERFVLQHRDDLERRPRLTRIGINRKVGILTKGLRWAYGRGMIARDAWLGTSAIEPLSRAEAGHRDRKKPKRAVTLKEVERVAVHLPRVPAAMLRLQALIGCRPGEVCAIRWCDIDKTPVKVGEIACWTYYVAGAKAEHHGKVTSYAITPRAQQILEQFPPRSPGAFLFSPADTMRELGVVRRQHRKTPSTKQMRNRDAADGREFADRYDVSTYRQAIQRGISRANKAAAAAGKPAEAVTPFSPHEVRHGAVTRAAARFGAFAASAFANHSSVQTTEAYVHVPDFERYRVAVGLDS
jgi:integrase